MRERMKWKLAFLLDRVLPGQCWSRLVDWVFGTRRNLWSPMTSVCRDDLSRRGACYCGKLRAPEEVPRTADVIMCRHCEQPIELLVPDGYVNQRWLHVSAVGEWDGCGNSARTVAEPR